MVQSPQSTTATELYRFWLQPFMPMKPNKTLLGTVSWFKYEHPQTETAVFSLYSQISLHPHSCDHSVGPFWSFIVAPKSHLMSQFVGYYHSNPKSRRCWGFIRVIQQCGFPICGQSPVFHSTRLEIRNSC